jgi:hypothetical protein
MTCDLSGARCNLGKWPGISIYMWGELVCEPTVASTVSPTPARGPD